MQSNSSFALRLLLVLAALLGFGVVLLGALGAHAVRPRVSPEQYQSFLDARFYLGLHVLAATSLALTLALGRQAQGKQFAWLLVGYGWVLGAICFALPIVLRSFTGWGGLSMLSPVGGLLLMAAWLALAGLALRLRFQ